MKRKIYVVGVILSAVVCFPVLGTSTITVNAEIRSEAEYQSALERYNFLRNISRQTGQVSKEEARLAQEILAYRSSKLEQSKCTVEFTDGQGRTLKTLDVLKGGYALPPSVPNRAGYEFVGWDKSCSKIQSNTIINAVWKKRVFKNLY